MDWHADPTVGDWWVESLRPFHDYCVGSLVPAGFATVTRVMHPIRTRDGIEMRWSELAALNGRIAHPGMHLHAIAAPAATTPDHTDRHGYSSWDGDLPKREMHALIAILTTFTAGDAPCYFGVWDGYGGAPYPHPPADYRLDIPNRGHFLLAGCLDEIGEIATLLGGFHWSPNIWWPADRSWCVVSEIDFAWTYVAGPPQLARLLETDEILECYGVTYDGNHTVHGDVINR